MVDNVKPDGEAYEAVEFVRLVADAESNNRQEGLEDLKFRYGDQWPVQNQQSRVLEDRPALTINETDAYCRQITNQMRQQRPRIKVHPIDSFADVKTAEVLGGLCRHVEVNSGADIAYDLMGDFAVTIGWGYTRITTDFIREDSFNQDIYINPVYNPFSVYFDPNSVMPDGRDAERVLITDNVAKKAFKKMYPGAKFEGQFSARSTGDTSPEWVTNEDIRIAEYFTVEKRPARLVRLTNGRAFMDVYEDEMPSPEVMQREGLTLVGERASYKRVVLWRKQTAFEILEKKEWPGRYIPVIPCYGVRVMIDGKMKKMGAVRFGRDPQLMINFWTTSITECVAQAPKAKWVAAVGSLDGFESMYSKANVQANPILYYNPDVDGKDVPPPQRIQPEGPPQAMMVALSNANQNLQRVMGIFDPEVNVGGPKSGRAIRAEQNQAQQSNYHFYDNLTVSIKFIGQQILDLAPTIWDTERVMRIIGADGKPKQVVLNQAAAGRVLNDVTTGIYDVEMETGPGYNTRREESVDVFTALMGTPVGEKIAQVADDLVVRMMDVYGADAIADRLAAANPLSQIDEESEVPPQAQMLIKSLQDQLQKAMQALQMAGLEKKFGIDKERVKGEFSTRVATIAATAKAHATETTAEAQVRSEQIEAEGWRHEVLMKALTSLSVAELNGLSELLAHHMENKLAREMVQQKTNESQAEVMEVS